MNKKITFFLCLLTSLYVPQSMATDTREVIIGPQTGIVKVPAHVGHVLASPNRYFKLDTRPTNSIWEIYENAKEPVLWVDRSYLKDKNNVGIHYVYFNFDVDQPIDTAALEALIKKYPKENISYLLIGHADEVGSHLYNQRLSEQRAVNVKRILSTLSNVDAKKITAIGKGKTMPVSFTNQKLNRRVEVVVRAKDRNKYQQQQRTQKTSSNATTATLKREDDSMGSFGRINMSDLRDEDSLDNYQSNNIEPERKSIPTILPPIMQRQSDDREPLDIRGR